MASGFTIKTGEDGARILEIRGYSSLYSQNRFLCPQKLRATYIRSGSSASQSTMLQEIINESSGLDSDRGWLYVLESMWTAARRLDERESGGLREAREEAADSDKVDTVSRQGTWSCGQELSKLPYHRVRKKDVQ